MGIVTILLLGPAPPALARRVFVVALSDCFERYLYSCYIFYKSGRGLLFSGQMLDEYWFLDVVESL